METFDVVVVGGGIIGCSIAFELAAENLRVVVLDRQQPGQEASWAAAGMLSPSPDSSRDIPLVPLAKESLRLYPKFVRDIEESSDKSVSYSRNGALEMFLDHSGQTECDEFVAQHRRLGLISEPFPLDETRRQENFLGTSAKAAVLLTQEGTVDPRLLMEAELIAARGRGVEIRPGSEVKSLLKDRDRCGGVIANGKSVPAKYVVLATGCFSGNLLVEANVPGGQGSIRPVRGQMVALRAPNVRLERVLRSRDGYLVPRPDGRIVAGSTIEEAGFEKSVTAGGIRQILNSALRLCPKLAEAEITETWCGLRPGTSDDLPILGPTENPGLIIATGHYRNGILLAPVTARLVKQWILRDRVDFDASAFSPLRFRNSRLGVDGSQRGPFTSPEGKTTRLE